jgi:hypothetical protein
MRIYVASSWRNRRQPQVVAGLLEEGHEVYDFRGPDNNSFHWSEIDPNWREWSASEFRRALTHPIADRGFACDLEALRSADAVVLLLPCGRSAHLEAGWAAGAGKRVLILLDPDGNEPELMYKMAEVYTTLGDVEAALLEDSDPRPSLTEVISS